MTKRQYEAAAKRMRDIVARLESEARCERSLAFVTQRDNLREMYTRREAALDAAALALRDMYRGYFLEG
jgi:exonuclease VII small subunit